jgi:hypothetical protein
MNLKEIDLAGCWIGLIWLRYGSVGGSFEHGNEPTGVVSHLVFLDYPSKNLLLKNNYVAWSNSSLWHSFTLLILHVFLLQRDGVSFTLPPTYREGFPNLIKTRGTVRSIVFSYQTVTRPDRRISVL